MQADEPQDEEEGSRDRRDQAETRDAAADAEGAGRDGGRLFARLLMSREVIVAGTCKGEGAVFESSDGG